MHTTIALDCDEILADTIGWIFSYYQHTFNWLPIQRSDITSFFWHELPKFSATPEYTQAYRTDFFASEQATTIIPVPDAIQWVKALHELWYDLKVVTSRWVGTQKLTLEWIEKYFPGMFSDVVFGSATIETHHLTNKAELMTHIWATCLVDDGLHNCVQVSAWWYETLLLDNPWNQTAQKISNIKRVKDWQEIVDHFTQQKLQ